jgi:3-(3-hydroxy-phenyl)propionate hydroxylase
MTDYDVVIAGYGPTGAVAANLLGAADIRTLVVEPNPTIFDIPRAVHFDGEVMRIFQSLGLHDKISKIAAPAASIGFTNGRGWDLFRQDLSAIPRIHAWDNSNFFNQPALEKHLREGVTRYHCVECSLKESVSNFTLTKNGIEIEITSITDHSTTRRTVNTQYLLGCDGANSRVRKLMGISQEDLDCDEPWLVVDWLLPDDVEFKRNALQICNPQRPATLVPCQGNHIRWEFMVNEGDDIDSLENEANIRQLMAPHLHRLSPNLTPDMGRLVRSKVYNFHALIADTFQQDRVFILGDAAHQMPPFLGQGMCAGIRDAHNLCWKLAQVLKGGLPTKILTSYTSERHPHVFEIIKTAVGHGSVIQNRNPITSFIRDCYLKLGKQLPFLVGFLRFDLSWRLGPGLFSVQSVSKADQDSPIGQPLPQSTLQVTPQGQSRTSVLSDELLGPEFTLVSFNVDSNSLKEIRTSTFELTHLAIGPLANSTDINGVFEQWFRQHDARIALVRPDRHVYGLCNTQEQASGLIRNLEARLK